jgi:hypothetical protein
MTGCPRTVSWKALSVTELSAMLERESPPRHPRAFSL